MKKIDYIVPAYKVQEARLPEVYEMTLAVWRLFIDFGIPSDAKEFYRDFDGNYHFVAYRKLASQKPI